MIRAARVISSVAFGLMAAFATLGLLFVAGYAFEDPGGLAAVGLVALMVVPVVVLSVVARRWPQTAAWLLVGATAVLSACWVWAAVDPSWWDEYVDRTGPVLGVGALVLGLPVAVLGLRRPGTAGLLLLALAVVPYVAFLVSVADEPWRGLGASLSTSSTVASAPMLVVALLFLLAALLDRLAGPTTSAPGASARGPAASHEGFPSEDMRSDR